MPTLSVSDANYQRAPLRIEDVLFKPNFRERRYVARVDADGNIVLTIPHGGNRREALSFANQHRDWLEDQRVKAWEAKAEESNRCLRYGHELLFRGRRYKLKPGKYWGRPYVSFADQRVFIADADMDLARPVAVHLRDLAKEILPERVFALAGQCRLRVEKVVIRDQKTRWGSCSSNRTISLNWRLLQAPPAVSDYVILHELMHLKRFDHSPSFWRLVEKACPDFRQHETWLAAHQDELKW